MSLVVNGERGEVGLSVAGVDLVIVAEMGRLASLSTALKCLSLEDLYVRLVNVEVAAAVAAISHLCIRGDHATALGHMTLEDFPAIRTALNAALSHHIRSGKAGAAGEGAGLSAMPSRSVNG